MFVLLEVSDPARVCVLPLDNDGPAVTVREVCRGATLADVANAIDGVEFAATKARLAEIAGPRVATVAACVIVPDQTTDEADVLSNLFGPAVPLPPEGDTDDLAPALVTAR